MASSLLGLTMRDNGVSCEAGPRSLPMYPGNRANVERAVGVQAVLLRAEPEADLLFPHGLRCCGLN
jgi:hypothetical protein